MSDIFVPEEEIRRRDVNPFANLTPEFYEQHIGEMVAIDGSGKLLIAGTIDEVRTHLSISSPDIFHVFGVPDFSQATEADLRELFSE